MMLAALVAHVGAATALVITLAAQLRPTLGTAHTLALEPGLVRLLVVHAACPRVSATAMAIVAWWRATPAGRANADFRYWFGAGCAALAAESVVRAAAAALASPASTPMVWVERLRPPEHALTATLTLIVAGICWALALGSARAAARGSADGPDVWDAQGAAATMWWTAAIAIAVARLMAPLAVAFVLRLG